MSCVAVVVVVVAAAVAAAVPHLEEEEESHLVGILETGSKGKDRHESGYLYFSCVSFCIQKTPTGARAVVINLSPLLNKP